MPDPVRYRLTVSTRDMIARGDDRPSAGRVVSFSGVAFVRETRLGRRRDGTLVPRKVPTFTLEPLELVVGDLEVPLRRSRRVSSALPPDANLEPTTTRESP